MEFFEKCSRICWKDEILSDSNDAIEELFEFSISEMNHNVEEVLKLFENQRY